MTRAVVKSRLLGDMVVGRVWMSGECLCFVMLAEKGNLVARKNEE